jgi:hypothetical protein
MDYLRAAHGDETGGGSSRHACERSRRTHEQVHRDVRFFTRVTIEVTGAAEPK